MAINQELDNVTTESNITTPANMVSECVIEPTPPGATVELQGRCLNGSWLKITEQIGMFPLATPDASIEYKFVAKNMPDGEKVRVYFGE
jgi:hypothetical protein